ncbi:MAG: hypothetical protein IJ629_04970 [Clostridia bacterium]|nr:hypothetical protein [Clostridia bacterium]
MGKKIKKTLLLILLIVIVLGALALIQKPTASQAGNSKKSNSNVKIDLDITDNYFIAQTNDVYLNYKEYEGKTVRMEGYFYVYQDYLTGENYYAVVRNSPGCCGNDGLAGLDIKWDGEYPAVNAWIQVVGKISKYSEEDPTPVILVSSLEETPEGTGFVNQ